MKKRITALLVLLTIIMTYVPTMAANVYISGIKGWSVMLSNDCQGTAEIDYNTGVNGTPSLKIVNYSDRASNVFMLLSVSVPVEEGKTYSYGGVVKSDNSTAVQSAIDWNSRYSLLLFGKTCDFRKYEFRYVATQTKAVQLMFIIDGKTDGVWFDDMFFTDVETGENLLSNPDFNATDEEEEEKKVQVGENEYQQKFIDINNSSEYEASDADKLGSLFYNVPVYYKNITVDADNSDWGDITMAYMPVDDYSQFQIYAHDDEKEKDLKIDYAFAYDEEYFYMYYNVYDDLIETYAELGKYWQGDSIQFMLSNEGESVGYEIGLIHDHKEDVGKVYSSNLSEEQINSCILKTKREGNYTTYEAAIPWNIKYGSKPDKILFDFIVNDNDYNGRKYCVQLAPGIAEGKMNDAYPTLVMVEKDQDWYAWVDGTITPTMDEETIFNLYISNHGEDKAFTVNINGEEKNVTVKRGKGVRESVPVTFTEEKADFVKANVTYNGQEYELSHSVDVKRAKATQRVAKQYQKEALVFADELETLINECEAQGISTDYERVNWQTIKYFAGFMADDIGKEDMTRINYTYTQLVDIYNEAKSSLESYLAGEKTPFTVPKYVDTEFEIKGTTTYADTFDGEKHENRPVFLVGYGNFMTATRQMWNLKNLGVNSIQNELGINRIINAPSPGWTSGGKYNKSTADSAAVCQTDEKHSGERALKITNNSPKKSNIYSYFEQAFPVKPNTKYVGSAWVKGKNAKGSYITTDGWDGRVNYSIPEEWTKIDFTFTSKPDQYTRSFRIFTEDETEAIYFDDISIKEEGSDVELFYRGDFESISDDELEYSINPNGMLNVLELLQRAELANVSVDLLLSPHYMYSAFVEQYPEAAIPGGGFGNYNVNHPAAKKVLEDYLRYAIPIVREYKSLNSICLSNEPTFKSNRSVAYKEIWHAFLEEKHGDIETLNKKYRTDYKDFTEIEMPTEMSANPVCLDYQTFNNIQFSSWHNWMADLVHELAPGIPLHCKFMTFLCSYEESHARTNITAGYGLEYTADHLDINGCDSTNFYTDSAGNKVQTMWYDYQVSVKEAPIFDTEHHIMPDRADKIYSDEYDAYAVTNVWQGAVHYRANSVLWAWERTYDKSSVFWGLMTQRPKAVWGAGVVTHDLNRLSYQIEALQNEKTDIGILYSNATRLYDMTQINMQYETYNALVCLGKKIRFVTELQAEKMHNFDILFVPAIDYAMEGTLDNIIKFINNGGKVVLIGDNCFKYDEYMNDANAEKRQFILDNSTIFEGIQSEGSKLSGMTQNEYKALIRNFLCGENKMWIEVLDAKTGDICEDVEYSYAMHDGKIIINVCNYGNTTDVIVNVAGKKAQKSLELRSMTEQDDTVTAKKYMPILLEVEADSCFIDTYGHWAENNIFDAYNKNLVKGVTESRFNPDSGITRAEFVTMLIRAAEIRTEAYTGVFDDVDENAWYARYMQAAYNSGIVNDKLARPDELITREEMCDMAVRAYERKRKAFTKELTFIDTDEMADAISVSKAYALGVINGYEDNTFRPKGNLTRAEAVTVILNYHNVEV